MSYLERLIEGVEVEWRTLGEIAEILNGFAFKSSNYSQNGIRVVRISDVQKGKMSDKDLKYYPIETTKEIRRYLLKEDDLVMSLTGNCGRVAMISKNDLPAALNQRVACIRTNLSLVLTRYLFHYFDQNSFETIAMSSATGGGQKNLSTRWLSSYEIPIPPIEVQKEIVRILDSFTKLTAELTAELTARKQQYSYFREQLLNFDMDQVEHIPLGHEKAGKFIRGGGLQKKNFTKDGVGCIHYGQLYTHYGTYAFKTKTFVSEDFAKKARLASHGDIVIATTSENDEDVCKAVAWLGNEKIAISSDACFYKHSLNPKYVSYFFQTEQFHRQKRRFITGTKVRRVNTSNLSKIVIPIPSLDEQARIVSILEKFDTLTTSISEGLPKEIELRQKQYEYYRDLLLSFPKPEQE